MFTWKLPSLILWQMVLSQGYAWAEDKEHCEEYGRMLHADPSAVSQRAKKRGLPQVPAALPSSSKQLLSTGCPLLRLCTVGRLPPPAGVAADTILVSASVLGSLVT